MSQRTPHEIVDPADRRRAWLLAAGLFVLTVLVFSRGLANEFVAYDDPKYVAGNRRVLAGLTWDNARWALTSNYFSSWHPLTWLSHMTDAQLFGARPAGHHATSVVLFALAVVVLFAALRAGTGATWRSAAAAALFAVHPLRVQSVVWISERKDVLAILFGLLALYAYTRYARRPSVARYLLVALAAALSLMSKAMWVTLPAVLLLWDAWPLRRWSRERAKLLVAEKLPLLALSILSSVVTYWAQASGGAVTSTLYPLDQRLANAIVSYARYLIRFVWPVELAAYYPHPGSWPIAVVAGCAVGLIMLSIVAIALRRRYPYLLVGWLWFLGMMVPMIGLVQVGSQAMADRYTLAPMIGLTVAVVWLAAEMLPRGARLRAAVTGAVIVALAARTWVEVGHWRDTFTLFTRALEVTGDSYIAHGFVGTELSQRQRGDEALAHFDKALRINPRYAEVHYNLANLLMRRGELARAAHHFEEAARLMPELAPAHGNLGTLHARAGRMDEAARCFAQAIEADPLWPEAYMNLGNALAAQGRFDAAVEQLRRAVRLDPRNTTARRLLAEAEAATRQSSPSPPTSR